MKKVGILTINDYYNYGNRLQNYALQEILKSLDCEVKTIVNKPKDKKIKVEVREVNSLSKIIKAPINEKYFIINNKIKYEIYKNRYAKYGQAKLKKFKAFTKRYIIETDYIITEKNIPKDIASEYDFFIVGSDQIWNPIFRNGSENDFLVFAPKEKRISYAPSFGISDIPDEYVEKYKLWLNGINHISVREEVGSEIIKKLTNRNAPVLIDPTMVLEKENWEKLMRASEYKPQNKEYLLTYFLGEITKEYSTQIKKIAKENNLKIINLGDIRDKNRYSTDPSEFLDYINSSKLFFTDSFHGAVFSIILEKDFVVCNRVQNGLSMSSRIDTLLNKFNLSSRKFENIKYKDIFNIDFCNAKNILDREREKSINYIKNAIR